MCVELLMLEEGKYIANEGLVDDETLQILESYLVKLVNLVHSPISQEDL